MVRLPRQDLGVQPQEENVDLEGLGTSDVLKSKGSEAVKYGAEEDSREP